MYIKNIDRVTSASSNAHVHTDANGWHRSIIHLWSRFELIYQLRKPDRGSVRSRLALDEPKTLHYGLVWRAPPPKNPKPTTTAPQHRHTLWYVPLACWSFETLRLNILPSFGSPACPKILLLRFVSTSYNLSFRRLGPLEARSLNASRRSERKAWSPPTPK